MRQGKSCSHYSFKQEFDGPDKPLSIGRVSQAARVKVETIRYYEKAGLLPDPPCSAGGHRLYPGTLVKRLFFIRRGREPGFTLTAVRALLGLVDGGSDNALKQGRSRWPMRTRSNARLSI